MGRQNSQLSLRRNEPSHAPAVLAPKGLGVAGLLIVVWLTPSAECWPFGAPFIGRREPSGGELPVIRRFRHALSPMIVCRRHPMTLGVKVRNG
jgi:hypothetical protein